MHECLRYLSEVCVADAKSGNREQAYFGCWEFAPSLRGLYGQDG